MSYLTRKNDRLRRRKARMLTFLITASLLGAAAYSLGFGHQLPELFQQLIGNPPPTESVAANF